MLKGQKPNPERIRRIEEIKAERNCSYSTARYYYDIETGKISVNRSYKPLKGRAGITNNYWGKNQHTKDLSDEALAEIAAKKKEHEELMKQKHENSAIKKETIEEHSKLVKERARKIRDLNYWIKVAHDNYNASHSDVDKAIWKECIQNKKDYQKNNPKIKLNIKNQ